MSASHTLRATIAAILAASAGRVVAQSAELPVPCVAGVCGASIPGFVSAGRATATNTNNVLRIQQQTDRAILNWASFNVGADGRVVFEQPGVGSIALNRIFQGSPSRILGAIESNGQIFLVNQNGFLFGPTARVRTSGLLVSSLNMTDSTFENGLLSPDLLRNEAALESDGRVGVLDPQGNPVLGDDGQPLAVRIRIDAGARISTVGSGARTMIASRTVDNAGQIDAPDGQVILAAGEKVYLQASTNPALRGLLVEVDAGGEAWNRMTGDVSAARGNVTMIGLSVNQLGRVSATSTVSANGSIRLLARDSLQVEADGAGRPVMSTNRGGRLELGAASQTTVSPELGDRATAIDEQKQLPSSIELAGREVFVRGGAQVRAPGGDIHLRAVDDSQSLLSYDSQARVRVEAGAVIDASGSDATASVSRNVVRVELRGNELRDAPLQRSGALRGQEVFVDVRVGTPLADVSGAIAGIGRAIDERTSAGGNIVVESAGDIVVAPGATFDVSGGALTYTPGAVQTTQLLTADGRAVDIGLANPNQLYTGLINPSTQRRFDRWGVTERVQGPLIGRVEPGYVEGSSAGTLQFAARGLALDGTFAGGVTIGPHQRDAARAPQGGRFIVGAPDASAALGATVPDYRAPSIDLVTATTPLTVGDTGSLPQRPLELSTSFVSAGGFSRVDLNSNGVVRIPESIQLALAPGSSLRITAHRVEADGNVSAPAGSVRFASVLTAGVDNAALPRAGVSIGEHSLIDVRGLWNNELSLLTPIFRDGGEIDFAVRAQGGELVLGDAARLLADGGASLSASGSVTGGRGGRIALRAGAGGAAIDVGENVAISAFGVANARGGSFALEAPRLEIVADGDWAIPQRLDLGASDDGFFGIGSALFSNFGFASFDLAATGPRAGDERDTFVVRDGATLDARASTRLVDEGAAARVSGGTIDSFSRVSLAPDYARTATSIALRAEPRDLSNAEQIGRLSIEAGASVRVDARGGVSLTSVGGIAVGGDISAPGGSVSAFIPNPAEVALDAGYLPGFGISFLDGATVDVAGIVLLRPSDAALRQGEVLAGGSVSLLANRGSVSAADGASFDLSGASSAIDIAGAGQSGGYLRRQIGAAGGSLTVRAPEHLDFSAALNAAAGAGDTRSAGGSATFQLTRQRGFEFVATGLSHTFSSTPRTLLVTADPASAGTGTNGVGVIDVNLLRGSGIDALALEAGGRIELYAGADLTFGRSLSIAAPTIGVSGDGVSLRAPIVSFGTLVDTSSLPAPVSVPGTSRLDVSGDLVQLVGRTALTGIAGATFTAQREMRLRGFENAGTSIGELRIAGDLTLRAPLLYPTTQTQFTLVAAGGAQDRIRFESVGMPSTSVPLSVGGSLSVDARSIVQQTRIAAPFGQIRLNATEDLTLAAGSTTTVSAGDALLPFGRVQLGSEWVYQLGGTRILSPELATPNVDLAARDLAIESAATIDLAGGGDLYAYEWLPGTGGSRDALATGATPGLYAILPGMRDGFGTYDPQEYAGSDLVPGDSIYLSATDGLAAGVYPLLPARYALLPGALLVSAVPGTLDAAPDVSTRLADGTPVVAGYRTVAGTAIRDARFAGFAVRPGSYGRTLANYQDFRASTFDAESRPLAPDDAARMALSATRSFDLAGRVLSAANGMGAGASIDIAAPRLGVRGAGAPTIADAVNVDASILQGWNAASLLLGGRRAGDGTIVVTSDTVDFAAGTQLSGREVVAVARDTLRLGTGSALTSTGGIRAPQFDAESALRLASGDAGAAVLGVSGARALHVERDGVAAGGVIEMAAGSRIESSGSLLLDAPEAVRLDGSLVGAGATWALGSKDITLGGVGGADGLHLRADALRSLSDASRVQLSAANALTFAETLQLGSFTELVLDTPLLGAGAPAVEARFAADSITMRNSFAPSATAPVASGEGTLSFAALDVAIGPGSIAIDGFSGTAISAQREIVGIGAARLDIGGDLTLTAANVGAASDADLAISATGTISTRAADALSDTARVTGQLGGRVALAAAAIDHQGSIRVASGRIEIEAGDGISLRDGSLLDVAGVMVSAGGRSVGSGGGTLSLTTGGALDMAHGARLRVAGAGAADAGGIVIDAGAATLGAIYDGRASAGTRGGSFAATVASLSDFSSLNAALEAGGFDERRALRVATGDLTLAAGQSIVARDVMLSTDTGTLTIAGSIDASSDDQRGRIELAGGAGLVLAPTAQLSARGGATLGRGGEVVLASAAGDVNLSLGSSISLGGSRENGRLTLRAAATADGMRLGALDSTITGVDAIALQPVLSFALVNEPFDTDFEGVLGDTTAFMDVAGPALHARFAASATPVVVRPGMDLHADGDLTLGALELAAWRFGGEAAALAFSATGDIRIMDAISDGVRTVGAGANRRLELLDGGSSSLSFDAGGSVTVAFNARVRTGTGDITLRAGNDIVFEEGASVWTAGLPAGTPHVFPRGASFGLPTQGGRVALLAGNDVLGAPVTQAVGEWQIRQGRPLALPTSTPGWGSDIQAFGWNVGTFGGGDIEVRANGNIRDLTAAAADSATRTGNALEQFGGGVLELDAGRDISSVFLHVTRGDNVLRAGGALSSSRSDSLGAPLGSLFSMQEASIDVLARRGISIESVFNPTLLTQTQQGVALRSYFLSFAPESRLRARTATGDVSLQGTKERLDPFIGLDVIGNNDGALFALLPPSLQLEATDGDISLNGTTTMAPSDRGRLELFARRDIEMPASGATFAMSDAAAASMPTKLAPFEQQSFVIDLIADAASGRHALDDAPALISAGRDILRAYFLLPKFARLSADRDIRNTALQAQNVRDGDATLIAAGRDFIYDLDSGNRQVQIGGSGRLDVVAGRDVDLGFATGISSVGRLVNPALPNERGAAISVLAGVSGEGALDVGAFLNRVVAPSAAYRTALRNFVAGVTGRLVAGDDEALAQFGGLAADVQRSFLLPIFFGELVASGREVNTIPGTGFERGYAAIDALFPGSREPDAAARYDGDIKLAFSRIYTLADADISLLAPGGLLNVGLANPPPGLAGNRGPSDLGIVAQRAGSVRIFTHDDVLVNQSRVFTLRGGDIAIWSTVGDIDAGRGAKSAISAPPPTILVDASGKVTLDFAGAVAGSGIRAIVTDENFDPGDVDLIAPSGIVDAGDAGIGSAGNLNVAAQQVVGLDNIQVGGTSSGVPAETGSLGAALSGASAVGSSASAASEAANVGAAAQSAAPVADSAFGFLDVFLEGFGAEVCKAEDVECLKRNQK